MTNEEEEIKAHEERDPGTASASINNPAGGEDSGKKGLFARIRHDHPVGFWLLAALILGLILM